MRKKFDAVKFQRKIREELSQKYSKTPERFIHELQENYSHLRKQRTATPTK
jgi:hypothetical protein